MQLFWTTPCAKFMAFNISKGKNLATRLVFASLLPLKRRVSHEAKSQDTSWFTAWSSKKRKVPTERIEESVRFDDRDVGKIYKKLLMDTNSLEDEKRERLTESQRCRVPRHLWQRKYSSVRTQKVKDANDLVLQININRGSINRPFLYIHSDRVYSGSLRLTLRLILVSFLFISFCLCPRLWNCSLSLKVNFSWVPLHSG